MRLLDLLLIESAARKLHGRIDFRGLKISIENRKGSMRKGIDSDGKPWKNKMSYPYGYIRLTQSHRDGEHIDCFIGPNENAENVYVVHTNNANGDSDEDKCFLGFDSAEEAKKAFMSNYNHPKFFRSMNTLKFNDFKKKVLSTKENPKQIRASLCAY